MIVRLKATGADPSDIVLQIKPSVWDDLPSSPIVSGSFGDIIYNRLLTVAMYLGLK